MVNSFDDTSYWFKAGLLFVLLALGSHAPGIYLPDFLEEKIRRDVLSNSGLWKTCTEYILYDEIECGDSKFIQTDWFMGVKILQCIGLAATILSAVVCFLLLIVVTSRKLLSANMTICFVALSALGPGTFLSMKMLLITPENTDYISQDLGLSFYLCVGATCSLLIAWILFIVDSRKRNS